ncbi:MAG: lipopolysaccharide heptosyltransferase II [Melioribacteraceae bacterium]|nr:lipopolysaccharide heptosyltransferase II [Melioribacteraceae bacterium]
MTPTKILIVQTAFLGAVIIITPLIKAVKELYPNALVDVMVIPQTSGVLENNPNINEIIIFDKRKNKIVSFIKTLQLLKKKQYDIAITPHSSITTALLLKLAKIPVRIGFDRWSASKHLTHKVPHPDGIHKTKKNLSLLSVLSANEFSNQTELFPTDAMFEKTETLLKEIKDNSKKLIAIAPGSVWNTKKWQTEYYKTLSNRLVDNNFGVVLIGSKDERGICNEVLPNKNGINLAGELSLLESAAVISKCDLMICNDSGALHIANAVETDVFAFFGPTVQSIGYYPFRENDFVFEREMECRPCGSHGGKSCYLKHHECMKKVYPKEVLGKVLDKFNY